MPLLGFARGGGAFSNQWGTVQKNSCMALRSLFENLGVGARITFKHV